MVSLSVSTKGAGDKPEEGALRGAKFTHSLFGGGAAARGGCEGEETSLCENFRMRFFTAGDSGCVVCDCFAGCI